MVGKGISAELYEKNCTIPNLPGFRYEATTFITATQQIVTCSGRGYGNTKFFDCLVLNLAAQRWEAGIIGDLKEERQFAAVVAMPWGVYVLGGESYKITRETSELLASGSNVWEAGPKLPGSFRGGCAVAISRDSFLMIDSYGPWQFNRSTAGPTSSEGWQPSSPWPQLQKTRGGQFGPSCALLGRTVVVAGGGSFDAGASAATELIDIDSRTIRFGGDMTQSRRAFHLILVESVTGSRILALGGEQKSTNLDSVEEWQSESETWKQISPLQERRYRYGAVAVPAHLVCPTMEK